MAVVTVASTKGGTGKSTLAFQLGQAAYKRGLPLVMIDTDAQGTLADWWGSDTHHIPGATAAQIKQYDQPGTLVIVDTPGHAADAVAGLEAADKVIGVSGASWSELKGLGFLEQMLAPAPIDMVVLTRVRSNARLHKQAKALAAERFGHRLIAVLPQRTEIEAAQAGRRPVSLPAEEMAAIDRMLDKVLRELRWRGK